MTDATAAAEHPSQPPRRTTSREIPVAGGDQVPKKKTSWWSRGPVVAGLVGSFFGLVGSVAGVGVIWGGSQASATTTADKVKLLEQAVEARADKATAEKLAQGLESKADRATAEKLDERVRAQELLTAELKAANTAQHKSIEDRVGAMEKNIDAKLDRVLARLPR
jgi:hypothetical protein